VLARQVLYHLSYIPSYIVKLLRNYQTVFQSGCTILLLYPLCTGGPVPPHSYQHLILSFFVTLAILV
jgi:hypothetical protein